MGSSEELLPSPRLPPLVGRELSVLSVLCPLLSCQVSCWPVPLLSQRARTLVTHFWGHSRTEDGSGGKHQGMWLGGRFSGGRGSSACWDRKQNVLAMPPASRGHQQTQLSARLQADLTCVGREAVAKSGLRVWGPKSLGVNTCFYGALFLRSARPSLENGRMFRLEHSRTGGKDV